MVEKKIFIEEWCKDLETGYHKQTFNRLRWGDLYDALGVAALITAKRLKLDIKQKSVLMVDDWLRDIIGNCDPIITVNNIEGSVTYHNDIMKCSFVDIAKGLRGRYLKETVVIK